LIIGLKNSASIILTSETKIELPKKVVPTPMNISLKRNPTKIEPIERINKGRDIFKGDSWA